MLEKTLESSLDCMELEPVDTNGDHASMFIGRTDAEAETPILWPLMRRTDSLEKTLLLGRIDVFELWCWRRHLRVPWTARRSHKSILKAINPEYSLKGLMLKLKLQYFDYLMQRADSLEKTLMLGKTEGKGEEGSRG